MSEEAGFEATRPVGHACVTQFAKFQCVQRPPFSGCTRTAVATVWYLFDCSHQSTAQTDMAENCQRMHYLNPFPVTFQRMSLRCSHLIHSHLALIPRWPISRQRYPAKKNSQAKMSIFISLGMRQVSLLSVSEAMVSGSTTSKKS